MLDNPILWYEPYSACYWKYAIVTCFCFREYAHVTCDSSHQYVFGTCSCSYILGYEFGIRSTLDEFGICFHGWHYINDEVYGWNSGRPT